MPNWFATALVMVLLVVSVLIGDFVYLVFLANREKRTSKKINMGPFYGALLILATGIPFWWWAGPAIIRLIKPWIDY